MKECCANCQHFEDHRDAPIIEEDGKIDMGWCEYYGETEYDDPMNVTCFEFEAKYTDA